MTQDPSAKAREVFRRVWWSDEQYLYPNSPNFEDRMVDAIAAALTEARNEALNEAAKVADDWGAQYHEAVYVDGKQSGQKAGWLSEKIRQLLPPEREWKS